MFWMHVWNSGFLKPPPVTKKYLPFYYITSGIADTSAEEEIKNKLFRRQYIP